jgi:hypothetical protein
MTAILLTLSTRHDGPTVSSPASVKRTSIESFIVSFALESGGAEEGPSVPLP